MGSVTSLAFLTPDVSNDLWRDVPAQRDVHSQRDTLRGCRNRTRSAMTGHERIYLF